MKKARILDSWKDISRYLEKDIKTCYRWEKELGLPVHRIDESSRSNVFAYTSEIDKWLAERAKEKEIIDPPFHKKKTFIYPVFSLVVIGLALFILIKNPFNKASRLNPQSQKYPAAFNTLKSPEGISGENQESANALLKRLSSETDDPWELYSMGNYYFKRGTRESNDIALALYLKVLKQERDFPLAFIGLAQCYINIIEHHWDHDISWLEKAQELLSKPDKKFNSYPEYYFAVAQIDLTKYIHFDLNTRQSALLKIEEGIAKFPNHPQLNHLLGEYHYLRFGESGDKEDFEKAFACMKKSYWLDPYAHSNSEYVELLILKQDFKTALEICSQIKSLDLTMESSFQLGEIYYFKGELDKSRSIFEEFETPLRLKIPALLYMGMIAAQKGEKERAASIIADIELLSMKNSPLGTAYFKLCSIYFGLGAREAGYKNLVMCLENKDLAKQRFIYLKYAALDRNFDGYRNEPRFQQMLGSR